MNQCTLDLVCVWTRKSSQIRLYTQMWWNTIHGTSSWERGNKKLANPERKSLGAESLSRNQMTFSGTWNELKHNIE